MYYDKSILNFLKNFSKDMYYCFVLVQDVTLQFLINKDTL